MTIKPLAPPPPKMGQPDASAPTAGGASSAVSTTPPIPLSELIDDKKKPIKESHMSQLLDLDEFESMMNSSEDNSYRESFGFNFDP